MLSMQARHIETVVSVATQAGPALSSSLVHKSWARCIKDHGLDPSKPAPARILPSHTVREHQEQIEEFLRVARAGMEQMYKRVSDLGYMLLLTDSAGITVDFIGNPAWDDELRHAGLYLGADWNEAHAGTCGVGTCLMEQVPITCHQTEHFDATHINLTCTAAPLFDPEGKLLAVLDVSAMHSPEARESQHLAYHLTSMYAQMIEDSNFLKYFRSHHILRLGTAWGLVEVAGEIMLAFDDDGVIVGANTGARSVFKAACSRGPDNTPVGHGLNELLDVPMDAIWRLARGGGGLDVSLVWSRWRDQYYATVIPPRTPAGSRVTVAQGSVAAVPKRNPNFAALDRLAGGDPVMQRLLEQSKRLMDRKVNILVQGETGSGKEVYARTLHECSARAKKPFIAVNCASIPETLIESELFGYTPGSFTGGKSKGMKGLILQADGGTLFLDEIGDMPLQLQTRFLRVLSESEVLPLGAERPVAVDFAVVAATHRDLRQAVAAGTFREDLYYRLCGATLHLPPLRDRKDMRYLIEKVFTEEARRIDTEPDISAEAMDLMMAYAWPGNIRQLRNAARFALALSASGPVAAEDLPMEIGAPGVGRSGSTAAWPRDPEAADAVAAAGGADPEAATLLSSLKRNKWNITSVADELDICRATVYRQMKRFNITAPHRV